MRLSEKVALVTGAGRGLGAGVTTALARAGCAVLATDILAHELSEVVSTWQMEGLPITGRLLDVADRGAFTDVVAGLLTEQGHVDIFVHCAAVMPRVSFAATTPAGWQRELAINLGGFLNGVHLLWPHMARQGWGQLIGVASGASQRGFRDEAIYAASKHALEGFVKSLAFAAAPLGIAVNTMGPGKLIKPTGLSAEEAAALPPADQRQWVAPELLGEAFVWLATQDPGRYNGLRFDAGPIVDTIAAEGFEFAFTPEKTTLYVDDMNARLQWWAQNH